MPAWPMYVERAFALTPAPASRKRPRPHPFSNWDTEMARESIRRLIPLQPTSVWTGHAEAVTGEDIAEQLDRAADHGLDSASR
jgi:hypothetical protein